MVHYNILQKRKTVDGPTLAGLHEYKKGLEDRDISMKVSQSRRQREVSDDRYENAVQLFSATKLTFLNKLKENIIARFSENLVFRAFSVVFNTGDFTNAIKIRH